MFGTIFSRHTTPRYICYAFLLPGSFISGFLAGVFLASQNATLYIPLIRGITHVNVSVIGLFMQITLSFSMSFIICLSRKKWLILLQCFAQALAFGIISTAVFLTYGSAHWLISAHTLFTRTALSISMFWLWFRLLVTQSDTTRRDFMFALLTTIVAAIFDCMLVIHINI